MKTADIMAIARRLEKLERMFYSGVDGNNSNCYGIVSSALKGNYKMEETITIEDLVHALDKCSKLWEKEIDTILFKD